MAGIGDYPYAFIVNGLGGSPPIPDAKLIYSTQVYPWNPRGERQGYFRLGVKAGLILMLPVFTLAKYERLPLGKVDVRFAPVRSDKGAATGWEFVHISIKPQIKTAEAIRICHSCGKQCGGCSVGAEPFVYSADQLRTNIGLN